MMATITRLPAEVIEMILENRNISLEDIENFQSTCEIFQQISFSNRFWRNKYLQRCSTAKKKYYTMKQTKIDCLNIKDQIEEGTKCIKKLQHYISLMSKYTLQQTDKNELECLLCSTAENSLLYFFILDELNRIISTRLPRKLDFNLTERYNIDLIVYYLKQYRFIHKQTKFINMPKKTQLVEQQLTIMAQYFQPHISYEVINMWLDNIVQEVLTRLKNKYPKHSIFSISVEQFSFWRYNNIDDNFWNKTESKQIMNILEEFIFSDLEIDELSQLLRISDLAKEYINYISEYFRRYLLYFTYQSVARRLGIYCVLTSLLDETDIVIIWKPKYDTEDWYDAEYFYMSKISNRLYPSNIIRGRYRNEFIPHLLNTKIIRNMMMHFYELLNNHKINYKWEFNIFHTFLGYSLMDKDINIKFEYKKITMPIEIRPNIIETQDRNETVKFAIGMIVAHSWKHYFSNTKRNHHDGVIIGWHLKCDHTFSYRMNKTSKFPYLHQYCDDIYRVCKLSCTCKFFYTADQPHYIILAQNNKLCYAKQDDILKCPPREIDNIEIGRYFTRFEGTYYVPNESLAIEYPNDTVEMLEILSNH